MLTVKQIESAKMKPGRYADRDGLYMQVTGDPGALRKSWVLRYQVAGRRREMGLGPISEVPLTAARELVADARKLIKAGVDPIDQRRRDDQAEAGRAAAEAPKTATFAQVALEHIASHEAGWRNAKHAQQWRNTLSTYAFPVIGNVPVADVDETHVLRVLRPIWRSKTETASRLRGRVEVILDAARVLKLRTGENPARWKGHLQHLLPKREDVAPVEHHEAMPIDEVPAFVAKLREHSGMSPMCLELVVLTAVRSGEALNAEWSEFDREARLWTIPAQRTKTGKRDHRVPLSDSAIALLDRAAALRQNEYVFPGVRSGRPMSDMALTMLLRDVRPGITVHGFRSTFRDWTAERTDYPNELCEMALGHTVGDKVEAAYRRGDMFERRRQLMEDWAAWCEGGLRSGDVTTSSRARGPRAAARTETAAA